LKDIVKIIRYSWDLRKYYLATIIFVVIISLLNQATPFLIKGAVDGIVSQNAGHHVAFSYYALILLAILAVGVTITLLSNVSGYIGDILGAKLNTLLSQRYYDHILGLPVEYYDNEVAGRITSRLERSITTISQLVTAFSNNFISMILTTLITLGILAYYSWPIALLMGALFPFYIWLTSLSSKRWQKYQEGINKDIDYANGRFIESINQIRVVKSFVQERIESGIFAGKRRSIESETKVQSRQWHNYDVARRLGLNVVFFLVYGFIIYETYTGHFTLGVMTLMISLATQAQFPLFGSSFIIESLQRAQAGSKDFFEVMDTKPTILDAKNAGKLEVKKGNIQYQSISFAYNGGKTVLEKLNFEIKPGSKVALVGESGQGKTTISNLLLRFYDPSAGKITIDGQNIGEVTQGSLRSNIGVVFQEPALFSGTVGDNIAYGTAKATKDQIVAAAKAANADTFIQKLPKGYETEIGERGVKLSGGQKQRVAIARAILKNPPILILDEATSSLDSKAEREVQDALEQLMANRTTLIIAHRLSTIQNVDLIIGLENGQISEMGTPAELAKGTGIYSELLALQQPTKANKSKLKKYDIARV
jgi:ATP-binding cassette subfamily B protein